MSVASFRRLQVFVEAVEAGSFQACADRLGITQASVSNHIRALEDRIGKQLFARMRGTSASLTEEGGRTYELSKELIERAQELCNGSHLSATERPRRQITLGIHGYLGTILARPLAEFVAGHSEVGVVIETCPYEKVIEGLAQGKLDIGCFFALRETLEVESSHLWTEPIGLYAGINHPLAQLNTVDASDLVKHPLIAMPTGVHLGKLIDAVLSGIGLKDYPVAFESDDAYLAVEAMRLGTGYGFLFKRHAHGAGLANGVLKQLNIDLPGLQVRLATQRKLRLDRAVQTIIKFLGASAQSDLRSWSAAHPGEVVS